MSHGDLYCPACMKNTPHIKVNGTTLKCMICGRERMGSTVGSQGTPGQAQAEHHRHA